MALTITVEDGSVVANANSFLSLVDARSLAESRGITLPVADADANAALVKGAIYITDQEYLLQGSRVSALQLLSYPRSDVIRYSFDLDDDYIPYEIKCAQIEAAALIGAGTNPSPVDNGKEVKTQEVVGAVKREFFESGSTASSIKLTSAINCLYPITKAALGSNGFGNTFSVTRG